MTKNKFILYKSYDVTDTFEYFKDENGRCFLIKKEWQKHDIYEEITEEEYRTIHDNSFPGFLNVKSENCKKIKT